jgi:hypothetical protein
MISDPKLPLAPNSVEELDPPPERSAPTDSRHASSSAVRLWLRRIGVLFFVFLCATVGVMLIMLPWRLGWTENHLLLAYPTLQAIFSNGFFRGLCTGLGFLNVWIGFQEALQYRED